MVGEDDDAAMWLIGSELCAFVHEPFDILFMSLIVGFYGPILDPLEVTQASLNDFCSGRGYMGP